MTWHDYEAIIINLDYKRFIFSWDAYKFLSLLYLQIQYWSAWKYAFLLLLSLEDMKICFSIFPYFSLGPICQRINNFRLKSIFNQTKLRIYLRWADIALLHLEFKKLFQSENLPCCCIWILSFGRSVRDFWFVLLLQINSLESKHFFVFLNFLFSFVFYYLAYFNIY